MNRLDETSRALAREELAVDERIQYSTELGHLFEEIGLEVVKLERLLAQIPDECPTPELALELASRLSRSKRLQRSAAVIDFLLTRCEEVSIRLCRVHDVPWVRIGQARQEAYQNVIARFGGK